jgi:KaiC/GvpD/RAD55 family RecA-like ATPase
VLTIFGKKKKDEDNKATSDLASKPASAPPNTSPASSTSASSSQSPSKSSSQATPSISSTTSQTQSPPVVRQAPPQLVFRPSPNAPLPAEETSLSKLLQSLLADIPVTPDAASSFGPAQTTPDFVPVRSTPVSRPMIIEPGKDSGDWEESEEEQAKQSSTTPASKPAKLSEAQPSPSKVPTPTPSPASSKKDQPSEKAPEKTSKIEKQAEPPAKPAKVTRAPQGFEHIFQLTQGNLENTGLVIINGEAGSGRTTVCSGLTSTYMKMGSPCLYLTCDQSPSALRDQMKQLGTDATQYESSFRFIIVDGFAAQSEAFSMEMYYVEQPFNFDNIKEALVRNTGMFVGEKARVILDSLDSLAVKVPGQDFVKAFMELASKVKDTGATFIVTVDMSKLSKDAAGALNDLADCSVDLSKDDSDPNGRELKVQRLNHSSAKVDAETFEIDASKGLVFV